GGQLLGSDSIFVTPALTSAATYYVEAVSAGGCTSVSRTAVTVSVHALPAAPTVTPSSASVLSGQTIHLEVQNPVAGVVYRWYSAASGGTPVFTGTELTTPPLFSNTT